MSEPKVCPFCRGEYRRSYEEHTGSERHRDAIYAKTRRELPR